MKVVKVTIDELLDGVDTDSVSSMRSFIANVKVMREELRREEKRRDELGRANAEFTKKVNKKVVGYIIKSHDDGSVLVGGRVFGFVNPLKAARFDDAFSAYRQMDLIIGRGKAFKESYLPHVHELYADGTIGSEVVSGRDK